MSPSERTAAPRFEGAWLISVGTALGVLGLAFFGLGVLLNPRQALASYLAAYATGLSLALGALLLLMIARITGATWFVSLRRLTEGVTATLPLFALLFLPILAGLARLYPWDHPGARGTGPPAALAAQHLWFSPAFFVGRAILYFAVWIGVSWCLRRWSARADRGDPEGSEAEALARRARALSAGALPAVGLTLTFAAFDWLMSLTPEWFSTVYGVYYFAGAFLGALALLALLAAVAGGAGLLPHAVGAPQYLALGKLLLTFVVFWAYIAFAQLLVIWIADVPAEAAWYVIRLHGSWGGLGLVLLLGQFVVPFLILLFRSIKTRPRALAVLCAWLLLMHYLDVYWLVLPELHHGGLTPHWLDLAALAAVGGAAPAFGAWRLRGRSLVPPAVVGAGA